MKVWEEVKNQSEPLYAKYSGDAWGEIKLYRVHNVYILFTMHFCSNFRFPTIVAHFENFPHYNSDFEKFITPRIILYQNTFFVLIFYKCGKSEIWK